MVRKAVGRESVLGVSRAALAVVAALFCAAPVALWQAPAFAAQSGAQSDSQSDDLDLYARPSAPGAAAQARARAAAKAKAAQTASSRRAVKVAQNDRGSIGGSAAGEAGATRAPMPQADSLVDVQVQKAPAQNPIDTSGSFRAQSGFFDGATQGSLTTGYDLHPIEVKRSVRGSGVLLMLMMQYQADDNSVRKGETLSMAGIRYRPTFDFTVAPWLEGRVTPKLWMAQGYADSRLGNFVPPQSLSLWEAYLEARPFDFFAFQAGALNQARLDNEILIGDSSFPGLLQKISVGGDLLSAQLVAEQAVPTATSLSTNTVDAEATPSFFFESLILNTQPIRQIQARTYFSLFRFNDLPSVVAQTSETRGNSINEFGPNSSRFRYQFEGYVFGADGRVDLHRRFGVLGGWKMIQNTQAPDTYNTGSDAFMAFDIRVTPDVSIKPRADYFFLESDAAPAYWLESFYGAQTNRTGWAGSVTVDFLKSRMSAAAHLMHYDPINPNQWQASENLVFLDFTARHDLF